MLNIKINNEEVVSNKDFTIQEEMLNTPSVILNNVYPKTWEQDKDYVSRFYHPNDYSKCVISNDTYYPEEQGTTVENTSFSINNVDLNKNYDFTTFKGQTSQNGTPTPTSPVFIDTTTGRQDVVVCGKNLVDISKAIIGKAWNTISNTARAIVYIPCQPSTKYTISFTTISGTGIFVFGKVEQSDTTSPIGVNQITQTTTITTDSTMKYLGIQFNRTAITQEDIEATNIQIELGETSSSYEAYNGNTYEINLGKNLFDYQYSNLNNITRSTASEEINGFKLTSTGVSGFGYGALTLDNSLLGQTITISMTSSGNKTPSGRLFYVRDNGTIGTNVGAFWTTNNSHTETLPSTLPSGSKAIALVLYISQGNNASGDYAIFQDIQIEKGSVATEYTPYKTPIELCKIGNYQDFIRKGTGKNLANIENIQINKQWTGGYNSNRASILNIPIEPNTQYSIVGSWLNSHITQVRVVTFANIGDSVPIGVSTGTFTSPATANYVSIEVLADTSFTSAMLEGLIVMLCEGSDTTYEPYDFKDKWYIYKAINKFTLNGSESWSNDGGTVGTNYRHNITVANLNIPTPLGTTGNSLSNYFKSSTVGYNNQKWGNFYLSSTWLVMLDQDAEYSSVANFKTWLGTHPTSVYYVLATPTATEIEDSELISQLNGIELIQGLNNINIDTPYLPFIMTLHYNYVIEHTDSDILFCGVVKNSGNISLNPRDPHYQTLQILSYKTFLSEGETLDFVIYQKTIKEAIEQVVGVIADYGFVVGNINLINGEEVIGAYSTKDKTAYDVFNYIADITQSRWTTRLIDENTVAIDFYDPTLLPLGTAIDYTNEYFESHTIDNMSYSYGSNDYRNKQVMTSQEVYSNISQTQSVIANGYQTQFNVEQKIGKINSIKIGATSYTIATNQEKEMGVSADFYYTPGNNYFESATTIAVGTTITIEYIPIVEGRQIISNSTEIDRVANSTGVKGVVARYENRNDAITSQELQKIGQSYIKYKGVPEIILTVQTRSNLWNIGDRVSFNAPIDELKTEYMVKAKKINYITTIDTIFYTYELTSSFNSENAINYFDNQRAKATGNIGSGEYISRNIDIQSDANIIFYDTTATEIEIVGDNTLEAVLEAPFVS